MQFTGQTEQQTVGARVERLPGWVAYAVVAAVAACLFALRMAAPPTLLDQDQERPAAYVLDAVRNGHWLCQRDLTGDIASKPPLYTWLCALIALAIGRVNQLALYLPGALAALGTAWLVLRTGRTHFGARAGFLAALAVMLTSAGLKEFGLARTDGVFAFTVTVAAFLAYRAWVRGTGWMWFWLAAAAATLTKGPLGLVLASTGLLASPWILHGLRSRRREEADSQQQNADSPPHVGGYSLTGCHADHEISGLGLRAQLPGMLLFLALTCGWFLLAYREFGRPLAAKMLGQEFIGHAVEGGGHFPGALIYQQPLYYLGRAAPWSLLAYYGLWRVWRRPAQEALERRFERFLFCWFVPGLALFSLAPHQRGDLLWPLMPAGALIAGREAARLTKGFTTVAFSSLCAGAVVLALAGGAFYYFGPRARQPVIQQTVGLRELARAIEQCGGRDFPLTHVDDPTALQVYLNTLTPPVSFARAAQLLNGPEPAFVAVNDLAKLEAVRGSGSGSWDILLPHGPSASDSPTCVVGNRTKLTQTNSIAFCFGGLYIRAYGAKLLAATQREFVFVAQGKSGKVIITNEAAEPRRMLVCIAKGSRRNCQQRVLAGLETWEMEN